MTCKKCQQTNEKAHSFNTIGKMSNGTTIIFTCTSDAYTDNDSVNNFQYYKSHFDAIKGNWIWVIDCRDFNTPLSFETGKLIVKYLLQNHKDQLKGFYLFSPSVFFNAFIQLCYPFFPQSSRAKIHTYSDSILELIADLQRIGMPSKDGHALMLKFIKHA